MTRVDLIELLTGRPIIHPTRVERVIVCGDRLEMVVSGHPWWQEFRSDIASHQITLVFEAVSDGALPLPFDNHLSSEDLDHFSVEPLASIEWAQPLRNEIYCDAPLPDPAKIYSLLQAFLASANAFKKPGDFLNQGGLLANFTKITSGQSYLLARAPDFICRLLCNELARQMVPHNIIERHTGTEDRLWARLDGSGFICGSAWAEFET